MREWVHNTGQVRLSVSQGTCFILATVYMGSGAILERRIQEACDDGSPTVTRLFRLQTCDLR